MNTTANDKCPAASFGDQRGRKKEACAHNARPDLHGLGDPAEWGWRRPDIDDLVLERLVGLERMLDELG